VDDKGPTPEPRTEREPRRLQDMPREVEAEHSFGVDPDFLHQIVVCLDENRHEQLGEMLEDLHAADLADLIEQLDPEHRERLIQTLVPGFDAEVLSYLDAAVREEVVELIEPKELAAAVAELDTDDAVDVIQDLDEEDQKAILENLPAETRQLVEEGLTFPEYSAGRLMQRDLVSVPPFWTVGNTLDYLRAAGDDLPEDFYAIFIVDPLHRPIGAVLLGRVMRQRRPVVLADLMTEDIHRIPATMDQEEVAFLFRQYGLVSAPVVDASGRLIGVITVDDVVDVIDEEAEEDILKLAGVGETDLHLSVAQTAWRRVRWLVITLFNTIIASFVISHFESTIERVVVLAILMPIVAAMGGNAGMQVVTVTVRALATKDIGPGNVFRVVGKELLIGIINGVVFAAIMGTIAAVWFGNTQVAAVLAAAMVFNMVWAGLAGTLIPLALARVGADPAVAAGPFLTTTTDVLGFFIFLGLATLVLL